jgi:hypothetical protein
MTLIITAIAALIVIVLRFSKPVAADRLHLGALALMYAGASVMWTVDGFFCLAEGESFVELSDVATMTDDALLGVCVVVLGLVIWGIVLFVKHRKTAETTAAA